MEIVLPDRPTAAIRETELYRSVRWPQGCHGLKRR